jgi:uncharacterized membrane protein YfcA
MRDLLLFALAGFAATFVDGALGMGFGPTSSSILLGIGLAPAAASTCVNIAKVVTGIASAVAHWRFRNIDRGLVLALAVPGCIGAVLGVTVLSSVDGATIRPYLALLLTLVGLRILIRFIFPTVTAQSNEQPADRAPVRTLKRNSGGVAIAALVGGVTNGLIGAWGPIVTPYLLGQAVPPRFAIGSVNTAEVAVASASAFSLIGSLGMAGVDGLMLLSMLVGGVVAAPLAAWVIRYVPARAMGAAVAVLLLMTNARQLVGWAGFTLGPLTVTVYASAIALVVLAVHFARRSAASRNAPAAARAESRSFDAIIG